MEGGPSRLEIHTPVFDKKKKKYSVYKEGHLRSSHESFRDAPLTSEQRHITKSKKKRKDFQHFHSSPLQKSEICEETEKTTSIPKKNKKRRQKSLGVDEETGVVYVLVDKENIKDTPKNFRSDVDVVYVDTSKEQKPTQEPDADEPQSVPKSHENESEEPHHKVREKKRKKHRKNAASGDAVQESPRASLPLPDVEPPQPEAPLSVGPEGEIAQLPIPAGKKKSKKKKRKISHNQEFEAVPRPEGLENTHSEGCRGVSGVKKKSKKRKRSSSAESPVAPGGEFSALAASLEDAHFDSLLGNGTLIEEREEPRPREEKTQACMGEVQR